MSLFVEHQWAHLSVELLPIKEERVCRRSQSLTPIFGVASGAVLGSNGGALSALRGLPGLSHLGLAGVA